MVLYVHIMSLIALINGQLQLLTFKVCHKMSQNPMVFYVHIMSLIALINGQLELAPYIRGMPQNESKSNGTLCCTGKALEWPRLF